MSKPKFELDVSDWVIPLRYYNGWNIEFVTKTETFQSPVLNLFGFNSVKDLEKAIDYAVLKRDEIFKLREYIEGIQSHE